MILSVGSLLLVHTRIFGTVFIPGDILRVVEVSPYESKPPPLTGVVLWVVERQVFSPETVRWCRACSALVKLTPEERCEQCLRPTDPDVTLARARATLNLNLSILPSTTLLAP